MQLMLQATVCDCLSFDPFAFEEDGLGSSEVDVGRREIAQALVIAGMVVMSRLADSDHTSGRKTIWECRAFPAFAEPPNAIARPAG